MIDKQTNIHIQNVVNKQINIQNVADANKQTKVFAHSKFIVMNDPCCCTLCGSSSGTCTSGNCCGCGGSLCYSCTSSQTCNGINGGCLASGCLKNDLKSEVENNDVIKIFHHPERMVGLNISLEDSTIWVSLKHVMLLQDCETEIEAVHLRSKMMLCGDKQIGDINVEEVTNSYNILTRSGRIKTGGIHITDKHHKMVSLLDQLEYLYEHVIYKYFK
jgi:hypothetical protein